MRRHRPPGTIARAAVRGHLLEERAARNEAIARANQLQRWLNDARNDAHALRTRLMEVQITRAERATELARELLAVTRERDLARAQVEALQRPWWQRPWRHRPPGR